LPLCQQLLSWILSIMYKNFWTWKACVSPSRTVLSRPITRKKGYLPFPVSLHDLISCGNLFNWFLVSYIRLFASTDCWRYSKGHAHAVVNSWAFTEHARLAFLLLPLLKQGSVILPPSQTRENRLFTLTLTTFYTIREFYRHTE
jgi:hypothetical protein